MKKPRLQLTGAFSFYPGMRGPEGEIEASILSGVPLANLLYLFYLRLRRQRTFPFLRNLIVV